MCVSWYPASSTSNLIRWFPRFLWSLIKNVKKPYCIKSAFTLTSVWYSFISARPLKISWTLLNFLSRCLTNHPAEHIQICATAYSWFVFPPLTSYCYCLTQFATNHQSQLKSKHIFSWTSTHMAPTSIFFKNLQYSPCFFIYILDTSKIFGFGDCNHLTMLTKIRDNLHIQPMI